MSGGGSLERFRQVAPRGFVLDFDGTLAEIVARPELARLVDGAAETLARLASSNRLVAVVTGRPAAQIREVVGAPGVAVVGLYGLVEDPARRSGLERAASAIGEVLTNFPGAWVEDKGVSLAVHFRGVQDPARVERRLAGTLGEIAQAHGLHLFTGKRVLEITAGEVPSKGAAVVRLAREARLDGCLYAGDDLADLDAFGALDQLADEGVATVKVAVRSEESPAEVIAAADVVVDGPSGLVRLLPGV